MSRPIIILGAGASADYIDLDQIVADLNWCPPLANGIFNKRFEGIMRDYPEMRGLPGEINAAVKNKEDLESYLSNIQAKAGNSEERQRQILALQFYLQKLFLVITDKYSKQTSNNHSILINKIIDNSKEATIITFNYDKLFDVLVPGVGGNIQSYISESIRIIKLHGSCDWVYRLNDMYDEWVDEAGGSYKFLMQRPYHITNTEKNTEKEILIKQFYDESLGSRMHKAHYYPAMAIPVNIKDDFICPSRHVAIMERDLSQTNKILIIGWKAGDKKLLEKMQEVIKSPVEVSIVSGSPEGAQQVMQNMKHIDKFKFKLYDGGYSKFIGSKQSKDFFPI